ncbi:DUF2336 domain-containing protein [Ensifer sp. LCM 4579]|uniref:DUF2336 domain-containing protein n=1 Tax=Ensifer sp. LCM 4579 TaxID=1848292 RepID=UPI000AB91E0A|nr:DUF2336 domain-containing protein [Ensifer sp. LCM 4579]
MTDRFRELERPQKGRLKDVVLMATVTSFESLRTPRRSEMRQFSELFEPLFLGSSEEARRQAAAALSQCDHVPEAVALLIGSMPISVAASFLTRSKAVSDRTLISIIRKRGPAHASAIARRDDLSASVIDALVEHHKNAAASGQTREVTGPAPAAASSPSVEVADRTAVDRVAREDKLRDEIKALARAGSNAAAPSELPVIDEVHQALLVRFARTGETVLFANALADTLGASDSLAERILLDVSGQQLAMTLAALDFPSSDMASLLAALYPHLGDRLGGGTRADALIRALDPRASVERVKSWLRADDPGAQSLARHETHFADNRRPDPRRQDAHPSTADRDGVEQFRRTFGGR